MTTTPKVFDTEIFLSDSTESQKVPLGFSAFLFLKQ